MAVERALVLKAIELKFKGKSLTKNFKENIATKWAEKIEDEASIDSYIEDREDVIIEANAEADRRAIQASKKAKEDAEKGDQNPDPEPETTNDMPAWAKALVDSNKNLTDKLAGFENANKAKSIEERFLSHESIKGINLPDSVKAKYTPTSDEDFETAIESFQTDFKPLVEANVLSAYKNDTPASGDRGNPTEVKKISSEEAKKIVESMNN